MKECRVCRAETVADALRLLQAAAFLLRTIGDKADLSDMCQDHIEVAVAMYTDTVEKGAEGSGMGMDSFDAVINEASSPRDEIYDMRQKSGEDVHTSLFGLMETAAQLYLALPFSKESGRVVIEGAERQELERRYREFADAMSALLGPREEG